MGLTSARLPIGPAVGWVIHFVIGMVLALIYAAAFERRLPGTPLVRGLLYGVLVFAMAQLVFMPLVGGGVFSRGDGELLAGSLLGHLALRRADGLDLCGPQNRRLRPAAATHARTRPGRLVSAPTGAHRYVDGTAHPPSRIAPPTAMLHPERGAQIAQRSYEAPRCLIEFRARSK